MVPRGHIRGGGDDAPGDFAAGRARKLDRERQAARLEPEIKMVQPAALDLHDDFAGAGRWIGNFAEGKGSGRAVGDELNGFHGKDSTRAGAVEQGGSGRAAFEQFPILSRKYFHRA